MYSFSNLQKFWTKIHNELDYLWLVILDLPCWLLQQYTLRRVCSSLASSPVSVEWGSATHCRKAQVRPHHRHHASRPYWLPVRQRIQYKLGTMVFKCLRRMAPSYLAVNVHSCVVYNWSSTHSTRLYCPSRSDNPTQSIGATWITQLRHFRPFDLELVATDCSRPEPYIYWFL